MVGLLMSVLAYTDHKSGDYDRANRKKIWSWLCTALAFLIGITILTFVIVMLAAFADKAKEWWNEVKDQVKSWLCDIGIKGQC